MVAPMSKDYASGRTPPAPPAPDTRLVRAREVFVHLDEEDEIGVDIGGERFVAPRVALAVLDAFAAPRTVAEVVAAVADPGTERAREALEAIAELAHNAVLVSPEKRPGVTTRGWMKPSIHINMLDDRARTNGFCHALRQLVKPEDVVVDIGTGTGVLATCAAMAGARKVFAVESSGIGEIAERVFAANGVSDRVTLFRERSTNVSLPERGNILVTETIGNDPLDEQMLEIVTDAKKRLLVPGARIIPSKMEIFAIAVDVPRSILDRHVFTPRKLQAYREAYGIDFSPLTEHRLSPADPIMLEGRDVATWPLAPPLLLASIDLEGEFDPAISAQGEIVVSRDTQNLGVLLAFRAVLAPGITLSTLPDECDPLNHWAHALFPAFACPSLEKGASVSIDYWYERSLTGMRISKT